MVRSGLSERLDAMRPSTTFVMALLLLAILIAAVVQFSIMGNSSDSTTTTSALELVGRTLSGKTTPSL